MQRQKEKQVQNTHKYMKKPHYGGTPSKLEKESPIFTCLTNLRYSEDLEFFYNRYQSEKPSLEYRFTYEIKTNSLDSTRSNQVRNYSSYGFTRMVFTYKQSHKNTRY